MKRIFHTLAASFLFLAVCSLVGYLAYFTNITDFWVMFGIACGVLVAGVVLGLVKNRVCKIIAFFVNAVSMGFFLQSWYINRGFNNPLWLMLLVTLLAVAYMLVFALPLLIPAVNRHYKVYLLIFILLSLGGYVALLAFTKTTWVSTLGYYGILQLSFILGSSFKCNDFDEEVRALLISSYSIIVCAAIILIVVLGGDSCDCGSCDCGGDVGSPVQNKQKNQKGMLPPVNPPTDGV